MKVYELLDSPEKWTQGEETRYVDGVRSWCLLKAIELCYPFEQSSIWERVYERIDCGMIFRWNDSPDRTWQEVYDLCKELNI